MVARCADVLFEALQRHGIDTAFGIPGVHTLELYRALGAGDIRHITTRHEQGAAFMADGFARASGRPAACILITGPGLLNAATAIGQAYSDSVPMIVVSTVNRLEDLGLGRNRLHEMPDQLQAMHSLTRSATRLNHPNQVAPAIEMAMARLSLLRPRPTYLEVPLDICGAVVDEATSTYGEIFRPGPDPRAVEKAAQLLKSAKCPVLILGGGACGAGKMATQIAERVGAVVITTVAGKGTVPDMHPCSVGATLNDQGSHELLAQADVVVAVGTELASPDHFQNRLHIKGKLIRIDIDADVLVRDNPPVVGLISDAGEALSALAAVLYNEERRCWIDAPAIRERYRAIKRTQSPEHTEFLDALAQSVEDDAIIVSDMTRVAYTGNNYFPSEHPRTWLHPLGFGTLGYALPAAIGAKVAQPERQVIALAGDYGFGFTVQELATASDLGIALPIIIWNNGGLGQIALDMDRTDVPRTGVDIAPPDFASLSQAYGVRYARPKGPSGLSAAIADASSYKGPTIIDLHVTHGC